MPRAQEKSVFNQILATMIVLSLLISCILVYLHNSNSSVQIETLKDKIYLVYIPTGEGLVSQFGGSFIFKIVLILLIAYMYDRIAKFLESCPRIKKVCYCFAPIHSFFGLWIVLHVRHL